MTKPKKSAAKPANQRKEATASEIDDIFSQKGKVVDGSGTTPAPQPGAKPSEESSKAVKEPKRSMPGKDTSTRKKRKAGAVESLDTEGSVKTVVVFEDPTSKAKKPSTENSKQKLRDNDDDGFSDTRGSSNRNSRVYSTGLLVSH